MNIIKSGYCQAERFSCSGGQENLVEAVDWKTTSVHKKIFYTKSPWTIAPSSRAQGDIQCIVRLSYFYSRQVYKFGRSRFYYNDGARHGSQIRANCFELLLSVLKLVKWSPPTEEACPELVSGWPQVGVGRNKNFSRFLAPALKGGSAKKHLRSKILKRSQRPIANSQQLFYPKCHCEGGDTPTAAIS